MAEPVVIPNGGYLHFAHAYLLEGYPPITVYDGGVLEYSANGGAWTDAGSMMEVNGYDGTVSSSYSNPLGGRQAFSGDSHGYISTRLDLSSLAGQSVRFRWRLGLDEILTGGDAFSGWWVDDVAIYSCADTFIYLPLMER